ncbi:uncharacterized protein LOC122811177 isoform X2 [Protopterus annectens]|uniref:uncharacterized protein LOC122811177 isoform X2 n=1 Tax=Protopterus annectens TaxID=7888 RepID=UPI001CFB1E7E|nr:uncharacterized protein LOC122811177 isoform X2 [Protopterus annectens]
MNKRQDRQLETFSAGARVKFASNTILIFFGLHLLCQNSPSAAEPGLFQVQLIESPAGTGKYTCKNAIEACKLQNAVLATKAQLENALNLGFQTCSYGYVQIRKKCETKVYMPRATRHENCRNETGLLFKDVKSLKFDAFCYFQDTGTLIRTVEVNTRQTDIFQLLSPSEDPYPFNLYTAREACRKREGKIACISELESGLRDGYQSCRHGWAVDGRIIGPSLESSCTAGAQLFYYSQQGSYMYGIYCARSEGIDFYNTSVPSIQEALIFCRNKEARLASLEELLNLHQSGGKICSAGWVLIGQIVMPRNISAATCGRNQTGLISLKAINVLQNETAVNASAVFCIKLYADNIKEKVKGYNTSTGVVQLLSPMSDFPYPFTLAYAMKACLDGGTGIASTKEITFAVARGFNRCRAGWAINGLVIGPADPKNCTNNILYNYGHIQDSERYGAYCRGKQGVYFLNDNFTFEESLAACKKDGWSLAIITQLLAAVNNSVLTVCSPGWVVEGQIMLPRNMSHYKCGKGRKGALQLSAYSGVHTKSGAFCASPGAEKKDDLKSTDSASSLMKGLLSVEPLENHTLTASQAIEICQTVGSRIATVTETRISMKYGYENCRASWVIRPVAFGLLKNGTCYKGDDGTELYDHGELPVWRNMSVFCKSTQGFHFIENPKMNFYQALAACKKFKERMATSDELLTAARNGEIKICSSIWAVSGEVVIPRINPLPQCAKNNTGLFILGKSSKITSVLCVIPEKGKEEPHVPLESSSLFQMPASRDLLFSFTEARSVCDSVGKGLAPLDQAKSAHKKGLRNSRWSWTLDGRIVGPAALSEHCTASSPVVAFDYQAELPAGGVLCQGEHGVNVWEAEDISFSEAIMLCKNKNSTIASLSQLLNHRRTTKKTKICRNYWFVDGTLVQLGEALHQRTSGSLLNKNYAFCQKDHMTRSAVLAVGRSLLPSVQDVFLVPPKDNSNFTMAEAIRACLARNSVVATRQQVEHKMKTGYETCRKPSVYRRRQHVSKREGKKKRGKGHVKRKKSKLNMKGLKNITVRKKKRKLGIDNKAEAVNVQSHLNETCMLANVISSENSGFNKTNSDEAHSFVTIYRANVIELEVKTSSDLKIYSCNVRFSY